MGSSVTVGDRTVECGAGQPLLDAFLRAGVWMPNSCNQGTCGTCKLRGLEGDVDHRGSPLDTLPDAERQAGMAVACQGSPRGDVVVSARGAREAVRSRDAVRGLVATARAADEVALD